jgi:hypothetical protein
MSNAKPLEEKQMCTKPLGKKELVNFQQEHHDFDTRK